MTYLECCAQLGNPQNKGVGLLESRAGHEDATGAEARLRELGMLSLDKRKIWGDLRAPSSA